MHSLRERLKSILRRVRLLSAARKLKYWILILTNSRFRRHQRACRQGFLKFKREYGNTLLCKLDSNDHAPKTALVVSNGFPEGAKVELGLIKGLELAGFVPVVLTSRDRWLVKYYEVIGSAKILFLEDFADPVNLSVDKGMVARPKSFEDLLTFEYAGARVGRIVISTALRRLRVGSLDLQSSQISQYLARIIGSGMTHAIAAREIIRKVRPQLSVFGDNSVYTPYGQVFDACLAEGIDTITWYTGHKSNTLMLKRYSLEDRDEHPSSLSEESWRWLRSIEWMESHRERLRQEVYSAYASGDWYSQVGTQFNTRMIQPEEIRRCLGLDPKKKTAIIFPHIPWDATLFWGKGVFRDYEEWLVETVRIACTNDHVNWVIKVHPANVVKLIRDGVQEEPSELKTLRKHIAKLPPHISIIQADSDISCYSLFSVMDYCVTVRGTVGIEAASFGIPVLTAGTGRYDRKGFTIDAESRERYLDALAHIQDLLPLSPAQRELAERFAYGVFVLRPLCLTTFTLESERDAKATGKTRINAATREDWLNAPDLRAFGSWVNSRQIDFLMHS